MSSLVGGGGGGGGRGLYDYIHVEVKSLFLLQVQTRQWACNNEKTISCNCGAVLRDHNDVIEFNCCNKNRKRDETTPITVKIRSNKCLAPGISIKKLIPGINGKYEVSTFSLITISLFRQPITSHVITLFIIYCPLAWG